METVFWLCLALVAYHHLAYGLIVSVWARRLGLAPRQDIRQSDSLAVSSPHLPSVTIIVPAYNEERHIARKIANLAELDYPRDRLRIVVALDGCEDRTEAVARETVMALGAADAVEIRAFAVNRGKIAVLNEEIARADTDIVALSDASSELPADGLARLVEHFREAGVGVVCPAYVMPDDATVGERAYWEHQVSIKAAEGRIASPIGTHGHFYLFRRGLWTPLPQDTINDDFVLSMRIVERGFRAVYDASVPAVELERSPTRQDFRRRVRLGAGNLQQFLRLIGLAKPGRGALAFLFLSGKGLRAVSPLLVVLAFAASIGAALAGSELFRWIVAAELAGLAVAAGADLMGEDRSPRWATVVAYGVRGLLASALGALLFMLGAGRRAWSVSNASRKRDIRA